MNHTIDECYSKHGYPLGTNKEVIRMAILKKEEVKIKKNNRFATKM